MGLSDDKCQAAPSVFLKVFSKFFTGYLELMASLRLSIALARPSVSLPPA